MTIITIIIIIIIIIYIYIYIQIYTPVRPQELLVTLEGQDWDVDRLPPLAHFLFI